MFHLRLATALRRIRIAGLTGLAIGVLVGIAPAGRAQSETLTKGVLLSKVPTADAGINYSLFIPVSVDLSKPVTVLICFDPAALGAVPVERFRPIAEAHRLVIAGSNAPRTGNTKQDVKSAESVWVDLHRRLRVAPRGVYVVGYSWGMNPALELMTRHRDQLGGAIIGAAQADALTADSAPPFDLALFAAREDANRIGLEKLAATLQRRDVSARLFMALEATEWPRTETLRDIWEWLLRQQLRRQARPEVANEITSSMRRSFEYAASLEARSLWLEAYDSYAALSKEPDGGPWSSRAKAQLTHLEQLAAFKAARKSEEASRIQEQRLLDGVRRTISAIANSRPDAHTRRQLVVSLGLEKLRKDGAPTSQRALSRVFSDAYNVGLQGLLEGRIHQALGGLAVAVEARPDGPLALYNFACALALHGERVDALKYLKRAVATGRFTADQISKDPDFSALRDDPEYQKLIRPSM